MKKQPVEVIAKLSIEYFRLGFPRERSPIPHKLTITRNPSGIEATAT